MVPFSVLTNTAAPAISLRKKLVEDNSLAAVVELPSGVFRPYTDVRTALLLWDRNRQNAPVLMMRAQNDGYSLDDRREPIPDNDLPVLLDILKTSAPQRASKYVKPISVSELRQHNYVLSPSRFLEHIAPPRAKEMALVDALGGAVKSASHLRSVLKRIEELTQ